MPPRPRSGDDCLPAARKKPRPNLSTDVALLILSFLPHQYLFRLLCLSRAGWLGHACWQRAWPPDLRLPCLPSPRSCAVLSRHDSSLLHPVVDSSVSAAGTLRTCRAWLCAARSVRLVSWNAPDRTSELNCLRGWPHLDTLQFEHCRTFRDDEALWPLGLLSGLQSLGFVRCGTVPDLRWLAALPNLVRLSLEGGKCARARLHEALRGLRQLQELHLPHFGRSRCPVSLAGLRGLRTLKFSRDQSVGASVLPVLARLTQLEELSLNYGALSPEDVADLLRCLAQLPGLRRLCWHDSNGLLSDEVLQLASPRLPRVQSLWLSNAGLRTSAFFGQCLPALRRACVVRVLFLQDLDHLVATAEEVVVSGSACLRGLRFGDAYALRRLRLVGCTADVDGGALGYTPRLRALDVREHDGALTNLDSLARLPALASLDLRGTRLSKTNLDELARLRQRTGAVGFCAELLRLLRADGRGVGGSDYDKPRAWVDRSAGSVYFREPAPGSSSSQAYTLVRRALLRVDLEREASRDVLLRRHTFLARTGALPRLCWNNSEGTGGGGDVATACALHWGLPDDCRTARDLDFAPAREGGGGPAALQAWLQQSCGANTSSLASPAGRRAWPGESELVNNVAQLVEDGRSARGYADSQQRRFREGEHPLVVTEVGPYALFRYHIPDWGGLSLRLEGVSEPSTCNCHYALPSLKDARPGKPADGIWGGDELLRHGALLVEGAEGAPCSRLVFASPWSWAAYWSWRSWALLDAFTHWPDRVTPRWTATCTDLNKPLWHLEPVRLPGGDGAGVWTSCYQPLCPQPVSASFDWVKSQLQTEGEEEGDQGQPRQALGSSSWAAPDPDPDSVQRDTNQPPCGWDRGLCLAQQGRCSCYSDFLALPNTDPALLSLSPNGIARIPRSLREDACSLDVRSGCRAAQSKGSGATCNNKGQCVVDYRFGQRTGTCRCGSFVSVDGSDCYQYSEDEPEYCLNQPNAGFLDNYYTSPPHGYPASCNVPPQRCLHTFESNACRRWRGALVDRRDCFGCNLPRLKLSVPDSLARGVCDPAAGCSQCLTGYFGAYCEYVTLAWGCFDPAAAGSDTPSLCVWNWYLGQFEELRYSTIDADLLRVPRLFEKRPCALPACNGRGVCQQQRAFPGLEHDWDVLTPLPDFNYRLNRLLFDAYRLNLQQEEQVEASLRATALGQRCLCEQGYGGRFCETRVCVPACHPAATCVLPKENGARPFCRCPLDSSNRCLRPEQDTCRCDVMAFHDEGLQPWPEISCGPSTHSYLLATPNSFYRWTCECDPGFERCESDVCCSEPYSNFI
eukprot:g81291.t1